eukprot:1037864-Rhodomonas_salina.1
MPEKDGRSGVSKQQAVLLSSRCREKRENVAAKVVPSVGRRREERGGERRERTLARQSTAFVMRPFWNLRKHEECQGKSS